MLSCECGNELGETQFDVKVVQRPCQCTQSGSQRSPRPRIGLPEFISRAHYEERKRLDMPMVLPAERNLA